MKFLKSISLYFVYPFLCFCIGIFCGVKGFSFFYPGEITEQISPVTITQKCLSVDTEYCVESFNLTDGTTIQTTERLPRQYWGMDREGFLQALENYEEHPPLSEMEKGFVSLEVLSFAEDRVVVRKQYQKEQIYYVAVKDHEVVVYLSDRQTLFIQTGMQLERLPEDLQVKIIQCYEITGEENLYSFLENYTS